MLNESFDIGGSAELASLVDPAGQAVKSVWRIHIVCLMTILTGAVTSFADRVSFRQLRRAKKLKVSFYGREDASHHLKSVCALNKDLVSVLQRADLLCGCPPIIVTASNHKYPSLKVS